MKHYGLIGFPLGHSFSKRYFTEKFARENLAADYNLFELETVEMFPNFLKDNDLSGLNVTIPYKQSVIPFLNELDETAREVRAVNTIKFCKNGSLKGFNTDVIGFEQSLLPLLKSHHTRALVFGTGGASKAVAFVLKKLGIEFSFVSRTKLVGGFTYSEMTPELIASHFLLINTTPLGMFPKIEAKPEIPYNSLTANHLLYDLVYNPAKTVFLFEGEKRGATVQNGLPMLQAQAEAAYRVWCEE